MGTTMSRIPFSRVEDITQNPKLVGIKFIDSGTLVLENTGVNTVYLTGLDNGVVNKAARWSLKPGDGMDFEVGQSADSKAELYVFCDDGLTSTLSVNEIT